MPRPVIPDKVPQGDWGLAILHGNFNGTFDQVICDALRKVNDAQISLSPGFRWGTAVLPGQTITLDHVMDQTCITYPETYRRMQWGSCNGGLAITHLGMLDCKT
jgi:hypothetical protein